MDAVTVGAVEGVDPVGVLHTPGEAADDASGHDDADAARARVAGVDRVPGCGDPPAIRRLRQRDSAIACLRQRQPAAGSGERVHDAGLVKGDEKILAHRAERLRLPEKVGAGVHPAAGARAGAVRDDLLDVSGLRISNFLVFDAEGLGHTDHKDIAVISVLGEFGSAVQLRRKQRWLDCQRAAGIGVAGAPVAEGVGVASIEIGVEYPGSPALNVVRPEHY